MISANEIDLAPFAELGHGDPCEQVAAISRALLAPCRVSLERFVGVANFRLGDVRIVVHYERHKPRRGEIGVYRCDLLHLGDTLAFGTTVRSAATYALGAYRATLAADQRAARKWKALANLSPAYR